jgi:hypothetical protein
MAIPNNAHFVFALREQDEPFHLVHYLAIESCRQLLRPEVIYFHHRYLPYGVYWDLIRPQLTLVPAGLAPEVLGGPDGSNLVPARYSYAHHADFVRLDALIEHGGVYADIDTLFVRPLPAELYRQQFVIGREYPVRDELTGEVRPSLCNALMMAEPGAAFAVAWRQQMAAALNGTWSNHSGFLAQRLSRELPEAVHVEPARSFYRFGPDPASLRLLLEESEPDTEGIISIHLWAHLWWDAWRRDYSNVHGGVLTEHQLRASRSTYAGLARRFIPDLDLW